MYARSLFILAIVCCTVQSASAQIWVEFTSRKDTLAFLGSGSDNRIRIHNLPPGATVTIHRGAAVHFSGNEYVLCRFGSCHINKTAVKLIVSKNKQTIFSKKYTVNYTKPSGSDYNPVLYARIGKLGDYTDKPDTLKIEDFRSALKEGLTLSDTSCKLTGLTLGYYDCPDYKGPFHIGAPYVICGAADFVPPPADVLNKQIEARLKNVSKGRIIFLKCISASGPRGGIYTVSSKIIYVR